MLRRAVYISAVLMLLGIGLFYSGTSAEQDGMGAASIIGAALFLLGLIGAFAGVSTWVLTGMASQAKKDKT